LGQIAGASHSSSCEDEPAVLAGVLMRISGSDSSRVAICAYRFTVQDYPWLTTWTAMLGYFLWKAPILMALFAIAFLFICSFRWICAHLPYRRGWRRKTYSRSLLIVFGAIALLVSTMQPAHAIFLSGMEEFITQLASESAGGGEGISEEAIALVFNVIRAVFLLLVAAAALFAYNQAQQGNDWRPIATQVGLAFGIVLGLDVITAIFVPES
jgi:hypothetical protein